MAHREIIVVSRGSGLALKQTEIVTRLLSRHHPHLLFPVVAVKTEGDKLLETPLHTIPGKGVFVKEVEERLLRGEARLAVHSMKDLPIDLPQGLCVASVPERGDFRDALISRDMLTLNALPHSAVVGTSSPRRKAQLLACRPDLQVENIRGNLETRIAKLHGRRSSSVAYDAIVVAAVGCLRAGYASEISEYLVPEVMLPAAGQGALAVECRQDDEEAMSIAATVNDPLSRAAVEAERSLVKRLGGGCHTPMGALATIEGGHLRLRGAVLSPDGKRVFKAESSSPITGAESLAEAVAQRLFGSGAKELIR